MKNKKNEGGTQESLDFIIKHMVVKSDVVNMATKDDVKELKTTLDEHSRDLNQIKKDVETNLDKRLQLDVRVHTIEKRLGIKNPTTV